MTDPTNNIECEAHRSMNQRFDQPIREGRQVMTTPNAKVTFWTAAPDDAPGEIKGYTCYFRPERLEWTVTPRFILVAAHGPATRVEYRQGSMSWRVLGRWGDERPSWPVDERPNWLMLPRGNSLAIAQNAVDRLSEEEKS